VELFYGEGMKNPTLLLALAFICGLGFSSCGESPEKKPIGPVSETSKIPWNTPVAGQGQGQFGMMPQNQFRR
jgi:hypothetical protein